MAFQEIIGRLYPFSCADLLKDSGYWRTRENLSPSILSRSGFKIKRRPWSKARYLILLFSQVWVPPSFYFFITFEIRPINFLKNARLKVGTGVGSSLFSDISEEVWLLVELRLRSRVSWFALWRAVWHPSRSSMVSISFSSLVWWPALPVNLKGFWTFLTAKKHSYEFKFTHWPTLGSLLTQLFNFRRSRIYSKFFGGSLTAISSSFSASLPSASAFSSSPLSPPLPSLYPLDSYLSFASGSLFPTSASSSLESLIISPTSRLALALVFLAGLVYSISFSLSSSSSS